VPQSKIIRLVVQQAEGCYTLIRYLRRGMNKFHTVRLVNCLVRIAAAFWFFISAMPSSLVPAAEALSPKERHEVPYTAYEGSARRIIIQATLNGKVDAPLVIDTGSPETIISTGLAQRLGLLDDDAVRLWILARGIGDTPAIYTIIDIIKIGDVEQQFVLTKIVPLPSKTLEGVLGLDFLSAYTTIIDPKRQVFILQEASYHTELYGGRNETWWRSNFRQLSSLRQAWRNNIERLNLALDNSPISIKDIDNTRKALAFSKRQSEDASRLFDKLDSYAIRYQVPMDWREN